MKSILAICFSLLALSSIAHATNEEREDACKQTFLQNNADFNETSWRICSISSAQIPILLACSRSLNPRIAGIEVTAMMNCGDVATADSDFIGCAQQLKQADPKASENKIIDMYLTCLRTP